MATIILSAVGTAIGGPIGGAIGAALGQQVDSRVFSPKRNREGPRLKELSVQTSSYGSQIPSIFGKMRISGSVIWATDIQESQNREGGGKGRPSTTTYSYTANFAVALSSRKAERIGRVWADGNLLRGASGSLKSGGEFRFYPGSGHQRPDPLIAADVGMQNCPAFRGLCYVVFENLPLADFGNRIPQLTFELIERETSVPISQIVGETSRGVVTGNTSAQVSGYAIEGSTARDAIRQLIDIFPHQLSPQGNQLRLAPIDSANAQDLNACPAAYLGDRQIPMPEFAQLAAQESGTGLALRYYDAARDYQPGLQRASFRLPKSGEQVLSLPATIGQAAAKQIVNELQVRQEQGRVQLTATIASPPSNIVAGGYYHFDFAPDVIWHVDMVEIQHYAIGVECTQFLPTALPQSAIVNDFYVSSPDREAGITHYEIIDLPAFPGSNPAQPIIAIAANGKGDDWRSAQILRKVDGGFLERDPQIGPSAAGTLSQPLPACSASYFDKSNVIEIELLNSRISIPESPGSILSQLAPVLWVGGELIRCGHIEMIGPDIARISQLQRGAFGSDDKIKAHMAGSMAFFLEENNLTILNPRDITVGSTLELGVIGRADPAFVEKQLLVEGKAVKPLAPVHGRAMLAQNGELALDWKRRSRIDTGWNDFTDQYNPEGDEKYELRGSGIVPFIVSGPSHVFSASETASILALPVAQRGIEIRQIGLHNISAALIVTPFE